MQKQAHDISTVARKYALDAKAKAALVVLCERLGKRPPEVIGLALKRLLDDMMQPEEAIDDAPD